MRTWIDTDEICENTRNITELLSASEINKFSGVGESIILLEECLNEEEYDFVPFSDAAFTLLKTLLRIRIKLRKTDPAHHLIPVLTLAVDGLREQLNLNRTHVSELIEMDVFLGRSRTFFWFACFTVVMLIVAAIFIWRQ